MVETDTTSPKPTEEPIPSIPQLARRSKENLMAISFSQRPKTPMRTYVVSGMLLCAMGVSLGFGIYLMFNPDHSEYSAMEREGHPTVEHDQVLISGLRKVVPMHNAPKGHNPTFGNPRNIDFTPGTVAPISHNVPAPLINHVPVSPAPTNHFSQPAASHVNHAPGAASAAVPYHPSHLPAPVHQPVFDTPQAVPAHAYAGSQQAAAPAYPQSAQTLVLTYKDARLKMFTTK